MNKPRQRMSPDEWDRAMLKLMHHAMVRATELAQDEREEPEFRQKQWDRAFKHWRDGVLKKAEIRMRLN